MTTITNRLDPITGGVISSGSTEGVGQSQGTGSGVSGGTGTVPDPTTQSYLGILQALSSFAPPPGASGDFETVLAKVTAKLKDSMGEVQESRANNEMETKRVSIKENEAKIEESKRKLDEAQAKKESGNIFDILSLVFQALAAAFMTVVGALLSVVPGFQAVGVALIISGVLMAINTVNSIVAKANDGAGILGSIAKAANADPNTIMGLDMAFTAGMVVAAIVAAVFTGGASAVGQVSALGAQISAQTVKIATTAVEVGLSLMSAAATVGKSAFDMSAAVDRADAKKLQAESNELQALMQQLDDMIDQAMQLLMQVKGNVNAMLDSFAEMLNDTGNTLSNTKFSG